MIKQLRWTSMSMSARVIAVLVGCLLISQLVSTLLYLDERSLMAEHSSEREASVRAADLIGLLDTLDRDGRERVQLSYKPQTHASVTNAPPLKAAGQNYRRAVAHILQRRFEHREIQVLAPDGNRAVDIVLSNTVGASSTTGDPSFDILTTLRDGQPVVLRVIGPSKLGLSLAFVLLLLLSLIATLCVGSFVLTRSFSRRLHGLAAAADAVGRGLQPAAIPESGPPELRTAARAFNRMQERLRRYLGSRTRVLTAMSHDLRTPITRLRLRVASIPDPLLQSKMAADLEQMASMVEESLESLQGLETVEDPQPVRVEPLLRALQSEYTELGFPLEVHCDVRESVPARPQALRRALTNLIDNARQFATAAVVRVQRVGDDCVFFIGDNGPGIPDTELERVFEPFYRLESSRNRNTGGAGLGLCIARDIAHAHGGELTLSNRSDGGLEAKLTLQMCMAPMREPARGLKRQFSESDNDQNYNNHRSSKGAPVR
jgi:signal transduction histidine kinase